VALEPGEVARMYWHLPRRCNKPASQPLTKA
jgi:hypothetical protein